MPCCSGGCIELSRSASLVADARAALGCVALVSQLREALTGVTGSPELYFSTCGVVTSPVTAAAARARSHALLVPIYPAGSKTLMRGSVCLQNRSFTVKTRRREQNLRRCCRGTDRRASRVRESGPLQLWSCASAYPHGTLQRFRTFTLLPTLSPNPEPHTPHAFGGTLSPDVEDHMRGRMLRSPTYLVVAAPSLEESKRRCCRQWRRRPSVSCCIEGPSMDGREPFTLLM